MFYLFLEWGENGYIRIKMGDTFNVCHESGYLGK